MKNTYGLVLSGGGTKGAYEIGAWKAMQELKVPVGAICGTSIGALNGALLLQTDVEKVIDLYKNIRMENIFTMPKNINPRKNIFDINNIQALTWEMVSQGGLDNAPLRKLIEENIDLEKLYTSPIDFGIVTYAVNKIEPIVMFKDQIPQNKMVDYLLASACFPIFKNQIIDDKAFVDGGVYDNMPINPLTDRGYRRIISIDVAGVGLLRPIQKAGHVYVKTIRCSEDLGGTFEFNPDLIDKNIKLGYLDTMRIFQQLYGHRYYFKLDDFQYLMSNFDLNTIAGLESAAEMYKINRYRIISAEDFLNELMNKHHIATMQFEAIKEKGLTSPLLKDIRKLKQLVDEGLGVVWFEKMLETQPSFKDNSVLSKVFGDYMQAAAAMIELQNHFNEQKAGIERFGKRNLFRNLLQNKFSI